MDLDGKSLPNCHTIRDNLRTSKAYLSLTGNCISPSIPEVARSLHAVIPSIENPTRGRLGFVSLERHYHEAKSLLAACDATHLSDRNMCIRRCPHNTVCDYPVFRGDLQNFIVCISNFSTQHVPAPGAYRSRPRPLCSPLAYIIFAELPNQLIQSFY